MKHEEVASRIKRRLKSVSDKVLKESYNDKQTVESDLVHQEVERLCRQCECALSMGMSTQKFTIHFAQFLATDIGSRLHLQLKKILDLSGLQY